MNILIAPNSFKNSLDATRVAEALAMGLNQSKLNCECTLFPVGDGGDGTGELIIKALDGEFVNAVVSDALGRKTTAAFGLIDNGNTAVIEMANASGMRLLKSSELNPMITNTTGTGELIIHALNKGVTKIIIGMGGSATVDGGMGMLSALGVKFLNAEGKLLKPIPAELINLAMVDTSGMDERAKNCEIIVLCDVDNRLLGAKGAAAVFGPQKGATPADVTALDAMLKNFAGIVLKQTGIDITTIKHSGTAGGAAAGLHAFLNAKLVSGADEFLKITGFDTALQTADVVFTGEGSIDEQTLQGKAPAVVAAHAKQKNLTVIGLAGNVPAQHNAALAKYFDMLLSINKEPFDRATMLQHTYQNLVRTATEVGNLLYKGNPA